MSNPRAFETVNRLLEAYGAYEEAMAETMAHGEECLPVLVAALNKKAIPVAEALGRLMTLPQAEAAIPRLLDFAFGQFPVFGTVAAAVARAGDAALPYVLKRLEDAVRQEDDEAVRNLLTIGVQLPDTTLPVLTKQAQRLFRHANPQIREAAIDSFGRLGLPHARPAIPALAELAERDPVEEVRAAARMALERLR